MSYQKNYDKFSRHELLEDIQQALQQQYGKEGLHLLLQTSYFRPRIYNCNPVKSDS